MDFSKKQQAIFYIEGNRAFFYPGPTGEMLQFPFPIDVVSDLEVLSRQKLLALIQAFFQTQNIAGYEILIVFATTTVFEKDFEQNETSQSAIQQFLDFIPFDEILTKTYTSDKTTKVVAINKQLYDVFKDVCESVKCHVAGVIAYSSLISLAPDLAQNVDIPLILTKFDQSKQFSIILTAHSQNIPTSQQPQSAPESNKRTFLLLGVFGVLVVILIGVVVSSLVLPQHPPITTTVRIAPVASGVSPTAQASSSARPTIPVQVKGEATQSAVQG